MYRSATRLGNPRHTLSRTCGRQYTHNLEPPSTARYRFWVRVDSSQSTCQPAMRDSREWPLVLNLHGFGDTRNVQRGRSQMDVLADTSGYIVVYPGGRQVSDPNFGTAPGWNFPGITASQDDIEFIQQLLAEIESTYPIDANRIHVAGYSAGAIMTSYLSCRLADKVASAAAIAAHSTIRLLDNCSPGRPFPIMIVHGTADPFVRYNPNNGFHAPTDSAFAFWSGNAGCSGSTVTDIPDTNTGDGSTAQLFAANDCADGADVHLYRIQGGGHTWPGGGNQNGNTNRDMNASRAALEFFANHPMPNMPTAIASEAPGVIELSASLYPNPFDNRITLEVITDGTERLAIEVFDVTGTRIGSESHQLATGLTRIPLESVLFNRPAGAYLVRVSSGGRTLTLPAFLNR